jgi:hypothetical protein
VERIQPGSSGGSQAQESWHRHKLKAFVKELSQQVNDFVIRLERFARARVSELRTTNTVLRDTPGEPFPDSYLLSSALLASRGRTAAQQYISTGANSGCGQIISNHFRVQRGAPPPPERIQPLARAPARSFGGNSCHQMMDVCTGVWHPHLVCS